jgi:hypothetical protein
MSLQNYEGSKQKSRQIMGKKTIEKVGKAKPNTQNTTLKLYRCQGYGSTNN